MTSYISRDLLLRHWRLHWWNLKWYLFIWVCWFLVLCKVLYNVWHDSSSASFTIVTNTQKKDQTLFPMGILFIRYGGFPQWSIKKRNRKLIYLLTILTTPRHRRLISIECYWTLTTLTLADGKVKLKVKWEIKWLSPNHHFPSQVSHPLTISNLKRNNQQILLSFLIITIGLIPWRMRTLRSSRVFQFSFLNRNLRFIYSRVKAKAT